MNIKRIISLTVLLLASCVTTKKSHTKETIATRDSVKTSISVVSDSFEAYMERSSHDTIIGIAGVEVDTTIDTADLTPLYDNKGNAVDRVLTFDKGTQHGTITVKANGAVRFDCKADSLAKIIQNLVVEKQGITHTKDSLIQQITKVDNRLTMKETSFTKKTIGFWNVLELCGACILIGMLIRPIIKFIKAFITHHTNG